MKHRASAYYSNGRVAWAIGDLRIASLYICGAYVPCIGWEIAKPRDIDHCNGWHQGELGEIRRDNHDLNV